MEHRADHGLAGDYQRAHETHVQSNFSMYKSHHFLRSAYLTSSQDGAACCIIASEDFVRRHGLVNQAIEISGNALVTDGVETFEARTAVELVGFSMTRRCADEVFSQAGFQTGEGRDQVAVVELHDCFASNEVSSSHYPRAVLTDRDRIVDHVRRPATLFAWRSCRGGRTG